MSKGIILVLIILSIYLFTSVCHYFISRYKQRSIQVFTIERFLNASHLNENDSQKKSLIDRINDFFDNSGSHKTTDGIDNSSDDNGGDGDDGAGE